MSTPHQYHQPNAPDSHSESSDSDLDLNLEELENDVSGSGIEDYLSRTEPHYMTKRWTNAQDVSTNQQIPLRNLRKGRVRGADRHLPRFGTENRTGNVDNNHGALLQEQNNSDESHGSLSLTDDAPLLDNKTDRNIESYISRDTNHFRGSRLGSLKAFFSRSRRSESAGWGFGSTKSGGTSRNIGIGQHQAPKFPPNAVSNAKYNAWSFLPLTLYNEFSFFFNLYFLLVALSQIIPPLRIGYLSTYVAPLAFVLTITLGKEALDDIARRKRDTDANKAEYTVFRYHDLSQGSLPRAKRQKGPQLRLKKAKVGSSVQSEQSRPD